jgi:transcriptional regulator of acetoin/glycerol metabolism
MNKTTSFRLDDEAPRPAEETTRPGLVLLYTRHPAAERAFPITRPVSLLGRNTACHLALPWEPTVSDKHATLTWDDGTLTLTDLGSHNGTFVNGVRVRTAVLAEQDVIRLCGTLFVVVQDGIDAHEPHRLDGTCATDSPVEADERARRPFAGGARLERVSSELARVATTRVTVLLRGETGTGKEVFARHVHRKSGREGQFVPVNASALAATLVEAELFGALRGSYSGATQERKGYVREAHRGTLFLDEIGDMPIEAQTRLLRVLQEREVVPVGASRPEKVDVRVVAATHQDLDALIAAGRFRADLYARLREHEVVLPPLRERREDLVPLCRLLLERHGRPDLALGLSFIEPLSVHAFPYNVRELEHVFTRALALLRPDARSLTNQDLPEGLRRARANAASPAPHRPNTPRHPTWRHPSWAARSRRAASRPPSRPRRLPA